LPGGLWLEPIKPAPPVFAEIAASEKSPGFLSVESIPHERGYGWVLGQLEILPTVGCTSLVNL